MDEKDLVEGMREYISLLQKEGRYSSAKSYQDAMNSFIRYSGTDRIPYTYINKDTLRRYEAYLLEKGCMRNTVSTYIRRLRCIYNKAVENGEAAFIPSLFKGVFTGVESQRKKSLPLGDLNRLMTVPVKGEKLRKTQLTLCLMFQYGGMSFVDFAHLNRVISRTAYWITIARRPGPLCGWRSWIRRRLCIRSWQVRGVEAPAIYFPF